jgi:hypothetical protein
MDVNTFMFYEQDTVLCHPQQDGYLTVNSRVAQGAYDILATRRKEGGDSTPDLASDRLAPHLKELVTLRLKRQIFVCADFWWGGCVRQGWG